MSEDQHRIDEIFREAREALAVARVGLQEAGRGPYHLKSGIRNVAVYGRMVTFSTNNLKGKLPGFEDLDREAKARHLDNPIAKAMSDARTSFEKQARNPIYSTTVLKRFSQAEMAALPRPDNAVAFFIGDRNGGSGWTLRMENGDEIPFYIDLPENIGESFATLPTSSGNVNALDAAEHYLASLGAYLDELAEFRETKQ